MSELLHPLYIAVMGTRYFSSLIVIVAVLFSGCKATRPASVFEQLAVEEVVEAEVREFSSQKAYPGVESNLRYTENFIVVWKASFNEPVEVIALLADSTRMPISFLKVDNEKQKAPFPDAHRCTGSTPVCVGLPRAAPKREVSPPSVPSANPDHPR